MLGCSVLVSGLAAMIPGWQQPCVQAVIDTSELYIEDIASAWPAQLVQACMSQARKVPAAHIAHNKHALHQTPLSDPLTCCSQRWQALAEISL